MFGKAIVSNLLVVALVCYAVVAHAEPVAVYWDESGVGIWRANPDGSEKALAVTWPGPGPSTLFQGIALDSAGGKIYYGAHDGAMETGIYRTNLDGTGLVTVAPIGYAYNPLGVALDLAGDKVYWVNGGDLSIRRANLEGTLMQTVWGAHDDNWANGGIAIDVAAQKVYWTQIRVSVGNSKIWRADFDGSGEEILVAGLGWPSDVALDLLHGKMYWTDGQVQRSNLDGTHVETLANIGAISAVALDPAGGKMYWGDTSAHAIWVANLDGSSPHIAITGANPNYIALQFTVPEPSTVGLLGVGAIALLAYGWRRRKAGSYDRVKCN